MGLCLWRWRRGEKFPYTGFSELRNSGKFSSESVTIAPSHCCIHIHRRSLIRQTQTDRKLISRVHGGRTHNCRTIQRNIEYDAQAGTFSSQPPLQADACTRTGEGCQDPNTQVPPHQPISAKLPLRIQHSTPLHEKHEAVVKMLTNERETTRQSLKR